jgi:cytoskeletal protein RodZ
MSQKLKYYCRGLGTGILVTALLLISRPSSGQESLTNEEIIARAEAMGMIKIDSLTDIPQPSNTSASTEDENNTETVMDTETTKTETVETESSDTETSETESAASETAASKEESESSPTATTSANASQSTTEDNSSKASDQPIAPTGSEKPPAAASTTDGQTASITIYRGNGSLTVSKALEHAGLIEDAQEYDRYLCAEGYDNALRVGVYHIPLGSTHEQIAKIITGKTT